MPSRNIIKEYAPGSFYHIYSRGVNKEAVFNKPEDYEVFLSLLKRYLDPNANRNQWRQPYPSYFENIELLCFALMPNHIHLLIYQRDRNSITQFMRSVMTSYSMYFNKTYKRVGPIFQSRYKASRISQDDYLDHISRYIHLNPSDWRTYRYSSLKYYLEDANAKWINPGKILELFPSTEQYLEFVSDYKGYKDMLDEIHWDLADQ